MKKYFDSIDYLRGFAAVVVCMYHFTNKQEYLPEGNPLKQIFSFGHFGVEMFFIISGLVIPYSMEKGRYTLSKFSIFLKKRFIRIEPPYLACVVLSLLLNYLTTKTPFYGGTPFRIDYAQVIYHMGYLNAFMNKDWLNPVFWTLAIEFQYYLLVALFFSLISHKNKFVWISVLVLFNLYSSFFDRNFVFNFSIFFTTGILVYRYLVNKLEVVYQISAVFGVSIFLFVRYSYEEFLVVLITVTFILLPLKKTKCSVLLGSISYSLYLLHLPIGLRLINLTYRFSENSLLRSGMILLALFVSVAAAYVYYRMIENPAKEISQSITYDEVYSETLAH